MDLADLGIIVVGVAVGGLVKDFTLANYLRYSAKKKRSREIDTLKKLEARMAARQVQATRAQEQMSKEA